MTESTTPDFASAAKEAAAEIMREVDAANAPPAETVTESQPADDAKPAERELPDILLKDQPAEEAAPADPVIQDDAPAEEQKTDEPIPPEWAVDVKHHGEVEVIDLRDKDKVRDLLEFGKGAKELKSKFEQRYEEGQQSVLKELQEKGILTYDHMKGWNLGPTAMQMAQGSNASTNPAIGASHSANGASQPAQGDASSGPAAGHSDAELEALRDAVLKQGTTAAWKAYDDAAKASILSRVERLVEEKFAAAQTQQQQTLAQQQQKTAAEAKFDKAHGALRSLYVDVTGKVDDEAWNQNKDLYRAIVANGGNTDQVIARAQQDARIYQKRRNELVKLVQAQGKGTTGAVNVTTRSGGQAKPKPKPAASRRPPSAQKNPFAAEVQRLRGMDLDEIVREAETG